MEAQTEQVESQLLEMLGDKVLYTFTQVHRPNNSQIMFRLRDKHEMEDILKKVEETFTNTPLVSYWSDSWNPAELPIPDPPDFEVSIRGSDNVLMAENARDLYTELQEKKLFSRVWLKPNAWTDKSIVVRPKSDQWQMLAANGMRLPFASPFASLADLTRTATVGRTVARVDIDNEDMDIFMRFAADYVNSPEELAALPVGVGTRIIPLKALADVNREEGQTPILRENGRQLFALRSRIKKDDLGRKDEILKEANQIVTDWPNMLAARLAKKTAEERSNAPAVSDLKAPSLPSFQIEDAQKEMDDALKQLITAITLSVVLIFLTMVFQFGSVMNSLLVLVAVPLGFIGVIASLWLFRSTLSLNSMLGVILLNGLSVANSIILVDFLQRSVASGIRPKLAAVQVARARLRPILMTSMTTGLGMLPVALGMGEGGRILQPLGIAVVGGLGFSMVTTLFIVPALQVSWLEFRERARKNPGGRAGRVPSQMTFGLAVFFFFGLLSMPSAVRAEEKPFSFKDAWTSILDRSLRLKSQQLSVEIASQRRLEKVGGFLPSLSLKGAETRSGDPFVGPRRSAEIDVDVNVFRSGRDLALTSAASKDLESAQNRFQSERQAVELQAAESLVHVIARTQQKKIVENIVKLKSESLRVARERFDRGLLPLQEVDKVAIELENSRARLIDAETNEAEARGQLRALLGHDAVEVLWPWKDALSKGQRLEETVFDLQARPDWKSAQATIEAEASRKRAALSRFFPSLDFTFSYGNADLSRPERRDWAAIATFSIPLFDGLSSYTGYQTQSLTLQAAQIQAEIVKRDAPVEMESLRQSHRAARDSALVREKTAKLSEKLFDDNFQRFRLGRTTVNELAIDQNRLFETELLAVEGWSNAHLTFVRLCHALGKSVSPSGQCAR
jgi:outer membrane protein TolC